MDIQILEKHEIKHGEKSWFLWATIENGVLLISQVLGNIADPQMIEAITREADLRGVTLG